MKKLLYCLFLTFVTPACPLSTPDTSDASHYESACNEISAMLDGRERINLKRAVFLVEWAYLDGKPDYGDFCTKIDSLAAAIRHFYDSNHLEKSKIGGNIALFEFFSRPCSMNGFRAFGYDFNDYRGEKDLTGIFVTKLMRTHTGQCRSLPLLYKILANEIGAEACIAYAPNHSFIRHRDETDTRWMNVELTNHSLPREVFIVETMGISQLAIDRGTYMKPCEDRTVVIHLLTELAETYLRKFGYIDPIVHKCLGTALKYDPENVSALMKVNNIYYSIAAQHRKELHEKGLPDDKLTEDLKFLLQDLEKRIAATGHIDMPDHLYDAWIESMEKEIVRRKKHENSH